MPTRPFALGRARPLADAGEAQPFHLPAHHLVTHGVVVGMTGSGKTGLSMVLVEEALRSGVPVLMIDVKGDLANLFLTFPALSGPEFEPWIDAVAAAREGQSPAAVAEGVAAHWREGLNRSGLGAADVASLRAQIAPRLITPGTTAGEPLHVLSALELPGTLFHEDEEAAREAVSASISLLLRFIGRDADPSRSREHVMLAHLAERRLRAGSPAGLRELLADLESPPLATIGALEVDDFLPPRERQKLAQDLNTLLASPTFATWRKGASLDIEQWLRPSIPVDAAPPLPGAPPRLRTPSVIVSVTHLDDAERQLVLGLIFEQLLAWVRGLSGTSDLRALVLFDEVFGFLPPHPANPPTKRPLLALLKQARAFGVGVVVATQNPMDLDYKALSNAGAWFVGRLQTDADRERVVEGLAGAEAAGSGLQAAELSHTLKSLPPRTFFVRDVHHRPPSLLLETRWTLSWLRGPLTRKEIQRLVRAAPAALPTPPTSPAAERPAPIVAIATKATPAPAGKPAPASKPAPVGPPPSPEGWKTYFAHPPAGASGPIRYAPWVSATIVAHLRDAKLGIAVNRTHLLAAPLGPDGRPDLGRVSALDPRHLSSEPVASASFRPLPEALRKKATVQAAERALKEHVYRSLEITVDVQRELGLVREDAEPREAFAQRCRAAAARRSAAEQQEILGRFAPRLARLDDRCGAAQARLAQAQAEHGSLPGAVSTALLGLVGAGRSARKADAQRDRAELRIEKARADLAEAQGALRELTLARDAEIQRLGGAVEQALAGIETRKLAPKKADVEVTEIAVAWGVE